jgi:hypothetical protein
MRSKENSFEQVFVIGDLLVQCPRKQNGCLQTKKYPIFGALALVLVSLEHDINACIF